MKGTVSKRTIKLLAAVSAATMASASHAQVADNNGAPAQATDSSPLGEIIVTAQRRNERLQDVPIAVASLSSAQLANANVVSALDIGKVTSGVIFQQSTGTVTTFIRGLGNNQLAVGNEASNSLYIDGVYFARIAPVMLRLDNVERVEILKGPQGTLFGRNATGGLINVITLSPEPGSELHGGATVSYGNYKSFEGSAYAYGGLSENLAFSLTGLYTNQADGWGTNFFNGQDVMKERNYATRGKLIFEPSDLTKITLSANYSKSISTIGLLNRYSGPNPAPAGFGDGSGLIPELPSRYDINSNLKDLANTRGWGGHIRLEQELSFANLVATVAAQDSRSDYHNDIDKTPLTYFHFEEDNVKDDQYSAELQLLSKAGSKINWTAGLFYLNQKFGFPIPAKIYGDSFGPGVTVLVSDGGKIQSYAAYGQASLPIADGLKLTLGGRFNRDEINGYGRTDIQIAGAGIITGTRQTASKTYDKATWRLALDYKVNPDLLVYGSISRGTKAGVFNIVTFNPTPVKPETLDAYEVGLKGELFDRRVRVAAAAFYYDYKNPQVQTQQPSGVTNLSNAKAAMAKGVELEAQYAPTSTLSFRLSGTVLDAHYTNYRDAPFYEPNPAPPYGLFPAVVGNANGNRLSRAPRFSGNVGVNYKVPLRTGTIDMGVNYAYTGRYYWTPDNLFAQRHYGLLDATLAYVFPGDHITVQAWGSNLAGAKYNLTANEFGGPVGLSSGPGAPRTYGIRLKLKQ